MGDWEHPRASQDAVSNRKLLEERRLLACGIILVYYKSKFQRNISLPPSGYKYMNRDVGFCLSKSWKPLISSLT
jgi:hypothetical protein